MRRHTAGLARVILDWLLKRRIQALAKGELLVGDCHVDGVDEIQDE